MLMEGIVNKFFKKDEKSSGPSLVEQINSQMKLLVEKSGILNDQFESEKNEIASIALEAADLGESKEILAAKLSKLVVDSGIRPLNMVICLFNMHSKSIGIYPFTNSKSHKLARYKQHSAF